MIKKCNKQILLPLGIGLVLGSAALTAAEYIPTFFDMDKDGDGVISVDEADYWSALTRAWENADRNHDNRIDMQEWNVLDTKALAAEGK
jgi:hypothetical protein